jgi:hypothetical protein
VQRNVSRDLGWCALFVFDEARVRGAASDVGRSIEVFICRCCLQITVATDLTPLLISLLYALRIVTFKSSIVTVAHRDIYVCRITAPFSVKKRKGVHASSYSTTVTTLP